MISERVKPDSWLSPKQRTRLLSASCVGALHAALIWMFLVHQTGTTLTLGSASRASTGLTVEASIYPEIRSQPSSTAGASSPQEKGESARHSRSRKVSPSKRIALSHSNALQGEHGTEENGIGSQGPQSITLLDPSDAQAANLVSDFQNRLLARIEAFRQYPDEAVRERLQGVVELYFTMDRKGLVLGVWIKQSSGYEILDKEAIATVLRAQPLPTIPAELPDTLNITLPVAFGQPS